MGIVAGTDFKTLKIEEFLFAKEQEHQQTRRAAAKKACNYTDNQRLCAQRRTVNHQLGIEQDGGHHKGREPVFAHSLLAKRRRNRDRAVHTEGGSNAKQTRRYDPQ